MSLNNKQVSDTTAPPTAIHATQRSFDDSLVVLQRRSVRVIVQKHVLAAAEAELNDVFLHQFDVALHVDALAVDVRPVRRPEVDDVRSDPPSGSTVAARVLDQPELQDGVLLRARRMVDRNVGDAAVATEQERALPVQVKDRQRGLALEWIEAPVLLGFPRLGRLVVFYHDAAERVRVLGQFARQLETRFLLFFLLLRSVVRRRRVVAATPVFGASVVAAALRTIVDGTSVVVPAFVALLAEELIVAWSALGRPVGVGTAMRRGSAIATATSVVFVDAWFYFHSLQINFHVFISSVNCGSRRVLGVFMSPIVFFMTSFDGGS